VIGNNSRNTFFTDKGQVKKMSKRKYVKRLIEDADAKTKKVEEELFNLRNFLFQNYRNILIEYDNLKLVKIILEGRED